MTRYIFRRVISIPLLLLGIVSIAFFISHNTQGDPLADVSVLERVAFVMRDGRVYRRD